MSLDVVLKIQAQFTSDPSSIAGLRNSFQRGLQGLTVPISATGAEAAARQIGGVTGALNSANVGAGIASGGMKSFGRAANQAASDIQVLSRVTVQSTGFLENLANQAGLASRRFLAFSIAAGSMVKLGGAIRDTISEAIDFERSMNKIAQVSGETSDKIKSIEDEITRLSSSFGVSSREIAGVAVTLKQAGLSADDTRIALQAVAEAALAPNFGSLKEIGEGAIATFRQFKVEAKDLSSVLGSMNAVAGEFAVESSDLVQAVQKAGGAFAQAGGNLNELLALFTSVRATTRESANEIATGLRTIFTRLQRNDTIEALKDFNIQLRHTSEESQRLAGNDSLTNQFVGAYEAVRRLSDGLKSIPQTDSRFSSIIEQLGGFREVSRVLPLINEIETAQKAYNVAQAGGVSTSIAAETAQSTLLAQTTRLKEEFLGLGRAVVGSNEFQAFARDAIDLAHGLLQVTSYLRPLVPMLTALAAVKLGQSVLSVFQGGGILAGFARNFTAPVGASTVTGLPTVKRAGGGIIPGVGDTDSVPAMLTPGEFVIRKQAAQQIGYEKLHHMNRYAGGGNVGRYAAAGKVYPADVGGALDKTVFAKAVNQYSASVTSDFGGFEGTPLYAAPENIAGYANSASTGLVGELFEKAANQEAAQVSLRTPTYRPGSKLSGTDYKRLLNFRSGLANRPSATEARLTRLLGREVGFADGGDVRGYAAAGKVYPALDEAHADRANILNNEAVTENSFGLIEKYNHLLGLPKELDFRKVAHRFGGMDGPIATNNNKIPLARGIYKNFNKAIVVDTSSPIGFMSTAYHELAHATNARLVEPLGKIDGPTPLIRATDRPGTYRDFAQRSLNNYLPYRIGYSGIQRYNKYYDGNQNAMLDEAFAYGFGEFISGNIAKKNLDVRGIDSAFYPHGHMSYGDKTRDDFASNVLPSLIKDVSALPNKIGQEHFFGLQDFDYYHKPLVNIPDPNKQKHFPVLRASGGAAGSSDTVPALLTPGEFVINKDAAASIGAANLHKMNAHGDASGVRGYARGGLVRHYSQGDSVESGEASKFSPEEIEKYGMPGKDGKKKLPYYHNQYVYEDEKGKQGSLSYPTFAEAELHRRKVNFLRGAEDSLGRVVRLQGHSGKVEPSASERVEVSFDGEDYLRKIGEEQSAFEARKRKSGAVPNLATSSGTTVEPASLPQPVILSQPPVEASSSGVVPLLANTQANEKELAGRRSLTDAERMKQFNYKKPQVTSDDERNRLLEAIHGKVSTSLLTRPFAQSIHPDEAQSIIDEHIIPSIRYYDKSKRLNKETGGTFADTDVSDPALQKDAIHFVRKRINTEIARAKRKRDKEAPVDSEILQEVGDGTAGIGNKRFERPDREALSNISKEEINQQRIDREAKVSYAVEDSLNASVGVSAARGGKFNLKRFRSGQAGPLPAEDVKDVPVPPSGGGGRNIIPPIAPPTGGLPGGDDPRGPINELIRALRELAEQVRASRAKVNNGAAASNGSVDAEFEKQKLITGPSLLHPPRLTDQRFFRALPPDGLRPSVGPFDLEKFGPPSPFIGLKPLGDDNALNNKAQAKADAGLFALGQFSKHGNQLNEVAKPLNDTGILTTKESTDALEKAQQGAYQYEALEQGKRSDRERARNFRTRTSIADVETKEGPNDTLIATRVIPSTEPGRQGPSNTNPQDVRLPEDPLAARAAMRASGINYQDEPIVREKIRDRTLEKLYAQRDEQNVRNGDVGISRLGRFSPQDQQSPSTLLKFGHDENGNRIAVGGDLHEQAQVEVGKKIAAKGGLVSDQTREELKNSELLKQSNAAYRELYSAQRNLIEKMHPLANSVEKDKIAHDEVTAALRGEVGVIKNSSNQYLGTEKRVDLANLKGVTPPGAGGIGYNLSNYYEKSKEFASSVGGRIGGLIGQESRLNQGVSRFTDKLPPNIGLAAAITLPVLGAGIDHYAGTAENAVAANREGQYATTKGAAGALTGAVVGATIGSSIPGVGTAIGGAVGLGVGAVSGFILSLKEAEKEIRQVKINEALTEFADKLQLVTAGSTDLGVLGAAHTKLRQADAETAAKNRDEATHFFGGFDQKEYDTLQKKSDRQDYGGQLPAFHQSLQKQAETLARDNPGAKPVQLVDSLVNGGNGLNRELLSKASSIQGRSISSFTDDLKKTIERTQESLRNQADAQKARVATENTSSSFGRLLQSVEAASTSLDELRNHSTILGDAFDGASRPVRLSAHTDNLQGLGREDNSFLEPLNLIRKVGGQAGENLYQSGVGANRVGNVLDGVLASVRKSKIADGEQAGADFTTRTRQGVVGALGYKKESELTNGERDALNVAIHGLNDKIAGSGGIHALNKEIDADPSRITEKLLAVKVDAIKDYGTRIGKRIEEEGNKFVEGIHQVRKQLDVIGELHDQQAHAKLDLERFQSDVSADRAGTRGSAQLSLAQLDAPRQARQERLTGFTGARANDPIAIGNALAEKNRQLKDLVEKQQKQFDKTGGVDTKTTEEFVRVRGEAENLRQALRELGNSAKTTAAAQERLGYLNRERDARQSAAVRQFGASDEEKLRQAQGLQKADIAIRNNGDTSNFSSEDKSQVAQSLSGLQGVVVNLGGRTGKAEDFLHELANKSDGGAFAPRADLEKERLQLQDQIAAQLKDSAKSFEALGKTFETASTGLINDLRKAHADFYSKLGQFYLVRDQLTSKKGELQTASGEKAVQDKKVEAAVLLRSAGVKDTKTLLSIQDPGTQKRLERFAAASQEELKQRNFAKDVETNFDDFYGKSINPLIENKKGSVSGLDYTNNKQRLVLLGEGAASEKLLPDIKKEVEARFPGISTDQLADFGDRFNTIFKANRAKANKGFLGSDGKLPDGSDTSKDGYSNTQEVLRASIRQAIIEEAKGSRTSIEAQNTLNKESFGLIGVGLNPNNLQKTLSDPKQAKQFLDSTKLFDGKDNRIEDAGDKAGTAAKNFDELNRQIEILNKKLETYGKEQNKAADAGAAPQAPLGEAQNRAGGGSIFQARGTDTVPAMLTPGEFVVNEKSARANASLLNHINNAKGLAYLAEGGPTDFQLWKARQSADKPLTDFQRYQAEQGGDKPLTDYQRWKNSSREAQSDNDNFSKLKFQPIAKSDRATDFQLWKADKERAAAGQVQEPEPDLRGPGDAYKPMTVKELAKLKEDFERDYPNQGEDTGENFRKLRPNLGVDHFPLAAGLLLGADPGAADLVNAAVKGAAGPKNDAVVPQRAVPVAPAAPRGLPGKIDWDAVRENVARKAAQNANAAPQDDVDPPAFPQNDLVQPDPRAFVDKAGVQDDVIQENDAARAAERRQTPLEKAQQGYKDNLSQEQAQLLLLARQNPFGKSGQYLAAQQAKNTVAYQQQAQRKQEEADRKITDNAPLDVELPEFARARRAAENRLGKLAGRDKYFARVGGRDAAEERERSFAGGRAIENLAAQSNLSDFQRRSFDTRGGAEGASIQAKGEYDKKAFSENFPYRLYLRSQQDSSSFRYRFATGGIVPGAGSGDSVPALLTPGEGVLNVGAVARVGAHNVQKLNKGGVVNSQYLAGGGVAQGGSGDLASGLSGFNESAAKLTEVMNSFAASATTLAQAINQMPHALTGTFTHTVAVNINGAEVLSRLEPQIQSLVVETTKAQLSKLFKEHLPDAGVSVGE